MFTLRLDQGDLAKLKALAEEQGLQYQSLLGSIINRYVNGTLIDITEAKKILVFQKAQQFIFYSDNFILLAFNQCYAVCFIFRSGQKIVYVLQVLLCIG